jgi:hypothetical protein
MSQWDNLDMDTKVTGILNVQFAAANHHFGRPFMTAYQIAIAFSDQFPLDFQTIGKPIGGKGIGQQDSLAQYIALQLSHRIRDGLLPHIEGAFMYQGNLESLRYEHQGQIIEYSSGLSMFRLVDVS